MGFGFLPPRLRERTRPCTRCGLNFIASAQKCTHCHSLSDREVEHLKDHIAHQHRNNSVLGLILLLMALLIGIALII